MFITFSQCTRDRFDLVIKNGIVYDGSGEAPVYADIGITDGTITKISKKISAGGAPVIDAGSYIVAPGFIDIHTHCDGELTKEGMNAVKNYLTQGVTTVVTGNCGSGTYEVKSFFSKLDSTGTGTNVIHLVGHNTIRRKVMGMDDREATPEELEAMKEMLRQGMEEGAAGFSTGLWYTPGAYSPTEEVIELAKVAKEYGGFYATHIRDESDYSVGLEEAVKEAVTIGEQAGIRVEISHIKAGAPVWGSSEKICAIIEEAQKRGLNILADQYPYNASSTNLAAVLLPAWVQSGGNMEARLNDPELLPQIKKEIIKNFERAGGPEGLLIASFKGDQSMEGKNFAEISREISKPLDETAIWLILNGNPSIVSFNMKESDVNNFMKKDYVMTCSDGHIFIPDASKPHPRNYGTFTRKIRKYVLDDQVISMEHAIRAATSLPAGMAGLKNRGCIKEGMKADIVVFNPETIRDMATYTDPHQYSEGIEYLLVNGNIVIDRGEYNGKLAGEHIKM
jgi:N-acyl-D-aspartate/D-glutamate deacylase